MMKSAYLFAVVIAVLLLACNPGTKPNKSETPAPPAPAADLQRARHTGRNLASQVKNMQITHSDSRDSSQQSQSTRALWIEINQLKREGQNVRQIEWYVTELENNLRRSQPDPMARQRLLNNLDYEVDALNRKLR